MRCQLLLLLLCMILCAASGCATHEDRLRDAREAFYAGAVDDALAHFEEERGKRKSSRDAVALDLAVAQLFAGDPRAAEHTLRDVRDRFDHLEQADLTESLRSVFTDDQARSYAGEDYERILIRAMLAISSLMHGGTDALAYSHQLNAKQQEIIEAGVEGEQENPKQAYRRVALGAYLHGILRESSHSSYDDAQRSFAQVVSWEPNFRPAAVDLARVQQGHHSARGNGVVFVFAFVGRGPRKVERVEVPTSQAVLIADQILSQVGEYTLPPTIAPIKVPAIAAQTNRIPSLTVNIDGQLMGETQTITDVTRLAIDQHQAVFSHLVARAVVRRAIKKAAVYAAKDHLEVSPLASLAFDVAGVAWEATESADTRGWGLLPDKIQVLRAELPVGDHAIWLTPTGARGGVEARVAIEDGRDTFVLAYFVDSRPIGRVLVSNH